MPCYFFSDKQYIRVTRADTGPGSVDAGYPKPISTWGWGSFGANGIDAALYSGSADYFFAGTQYIRVTRGTSGPGSVDAGYPKPISTWGWGSFGANGIDAALYSGPADYFFSRNEYIRVTRGESGPGTVDTGYPKPISTWGWGAFGANGIDAALYSGPVDYFFSKNEYIRVTRGESGPGTVDTGYPKPLSAWGWGSFGANGITGALYSGADQPAKGPVQPPDALYETLIASSQMMDLFKRTGGKYGPLGAVVTPAVRNPNGTFTQTHLMGEITKLTFDDLPVATAGYLSDVTIAVTKCFGTFTSGGDDTTFAVVSLISMDPNNVNAQTVTTVRTPIQNNVGGGAQIFKNFHIAQIPVTGSALAIHVSLWRHVDGNADDIRDKIHDTLNQGVNEAAQAIAGAIDDPGVTAGSVGSITDWSIGGVKPINLLTLGLANLFASLFADKLIDEYYYWIPPGNLVDFSNQQKFTASIRDPKTMGLDFDVQANWPPAPTENEHLFSGGGGSYKVWFRIVSTVEYTPVLPKLVVPG